MVNAIQSIRRCRSHYKPLQIVPKYADRAAVEDYIIFGQHQNPIGRFSIGNTGLISNFNIVEYVRRTKDSANAILSLRDFIANKAKEGRFDFLYFFSEKTKEKLPLKRMYEKLGAIFVGEENNRFCYFIPAEASEKLVEESQKLLQHIQKLCN